MGLNPVICLSSFPWMDLSFHCGLNASHTLYGPLCIKNISSHRRLSGMVSNRKSDKPSKELRPLVFRNRWWLNSVLTKVMWKPLWWWSFENFSIAFMWLWTGYGIQTAWGLSATRVLESISSFLLLVVWTLILSYNMGVTLVPSP